MVKTSENVGTIFVAHIPFLAKLTDKVPTKKRVVEPESTVIAEEYNTAGGPGSVAVEATVIALRKVCSVPTGSEDKHLLMAGL